jgi:hypothetical protein
MARLESGQVVYDANNRVTSWTDLSGHDHPAIKSTGSGYTMPLYEANQTPTGQPALKFNPNNFTGVAPTNDDTKECLDIGGTTDLDMTDGITWYIVYQTNTSNDNRRQIGSGYDNIDPGTSTYNYLTWGSTDGVTPTGTPTPPPAVNSYRATARDTTSPTGTLVTAALPSETTNVTDYYIGGGVWDNAADTIMGVIVKRDGTRVTTANTGATAVPNKNKFTRIGGAGGSTSQYPTGNTAFFNGHIAAVLVYNRKLSATEQVQVETYLRRTYLCNRTDFNADGKVNAQDLDMLVACFSGPEVTYANAVQCAVADLDGDEDVDQADFAVWQRCFSSNATPKPGCDN